MYKLLNLCNGKNTENFRYLITFKLDTNLCSSSEDIFSKSQTDHHGVNYRPTAYQADTSR